MKKVILLALLMPYPAFGQIIENFETENISNWVQNIEGHWNADTVTSLAGSYSLHHVYDNPDAGVDVIGLPVTSLHPAEGTTRWSFLVKYGYDPSSLNNWSVFLMSDVSPGTLSSPASVKGFAIGVNLTGSDDTLRLWKVNGSQITMVANSGINWQLDIGASVVIKILVERSAEGKWTVSVYDDADALLSTAAGQDSELFSPDWFEIYYKYSATHDRSLWLDNIEIDGSFYADTQPPVIKSGMPAGRNTLFIQFDEEPGEGIMIPEYLSFGEARNAISVVNAGTFQYIITSPVSFVNRKENTLTIKTLCDQNGNCIHDVSFDFTPSWVERGDVIISEIMADPTPVVSLPGVEYLEISNRTGYAFDLFRWKLSTESQSATFPEVVIPPNGIMIICQPKDTSLFNKYGKTVGLTSFPSLTDEGRILFLSDSTGNLIHGIEYSSEWYKDELKSDGGWSLEMKDVNFPFSGIENWQASYAKDGGTPGYENSVACINVDNSFYGLRNAFPVDSLTLALIFSEPVFNLEGSQGSIKIDGMTISDIQTSDPLYRKFAIKSDSPFKRGNTYKVELAGNITDFAGNNIQSRSFVFGLPETAEKKDVLFNEILFNPFPGDPDYIEFYNNSQKVIDASRLQVVSIGDDGKPSSAVPLWSEGRCILPGDYYAITTDPEKTCARYISSNANNIYRTGSLPSMSDEKGHLMLYSRELAQIDEVSYTKDMHYPLISDPEGVSLEKVNPSLNSEESPNWHSASEGSGWGTPGAKNSEYMENPAGENEIVLSSSKITPDDDGFEDLLSIKVKLKGNGNVVSASVFDEAGNFVKKLASNLFAGTEASIVWDGTADDGTVVNTGIYIVLITYYNDTGKTGKWKKICTVIR